MSRKSKSLKLQAALKLQRSHLSQRERGEPLARALPERWGWRISRTSTTGTPTTLPIAGVAICVVAGLGVLTDRKSTRLNSSHTVISYAVFCLKKKKKQY